MSGSELLYEPLDVTPRRGLIVWVYSLKQLKNLRRFGYVHHVSRKLKYVVLYVDEADVESVTDRLEKQFFVREVEPSMRPDINMDFNNRLGNKDMAEGKIIEFEEQDTEIILADFIEEE